MSGSQVEEIANAVLYEGYILYPYRPTSVKNRQRWTFGGVAPRDWSQAHGEFDPWRLQTECLVAAGQEPVLRLRVRFLHLMSREVYELRESSSDDATRSNRLANFPCRPEPQRRTSPELAAHVFEAERSFAAAQDDNFHGFRSVESLKVGERVFTSWQEAVEREVGELEFRLFDLVARPFNSLFTFPAQETTEPLHDADGELVGAIERRQAPLEGLIEVEASRPVEGHVKVTVRVLNVTPIPDPTQRSRDEALLQSFVSTHAILTIDGGEFVSLLDPPDDLRDIVAGCSNAGLWPVLVGDEGQRDALLASPIILYDYPEIAPESPGDLFDGTEIDEILSLRILAMTDDEKREMRQIDERARALLDRTEALTGEQFMRLHGTMRPVRSMEGRS